MSNKIYLSSPHMSGEELRYINEAFETNWVAPLGPNVSDFEEDICKYTGIKYSTALVSGTSAIHLGLKALGVGVGDVVFCSSLTFSASANPIIYQGAEPVFIDSDYKTWNMCPIALEMAFEGAKNDKRMPKAVVIVNLYGQSADYDKLREVCNKYNVPILEDAAESLGATYKEKKSGTLGDIGIFSFNGNKIITTSGGGMLVSNNNEYTKKSLFWATQSRENERHYEHKDVGFNYRMSNIVAGIGRGQVKVLDDRIAKKKEIYEIYKRGFSELECIEMMNICDYGEPNYWLSVITIKPGYNIKPLDIILNLEKENIESRPVWKPLHLQPFFEKYKFFTTNQDISVAQDLFNRGVCLPSDTKLSTNDILRVIDIVKNTVLSRSDMNNE
ncbi:MAG: DegT/DnrJ/EryC1/StrS family aminotransferase [Peptostreptococcaceae bacterium]